MTAEELAIAWERVHRKPLWSVTTYGYAVANAADPVSIARDRNERRRAAEALARFARTMPRLVYPLAVQRWA